MTTPTNNSDIRWQQRQQNFERALEKLEQACQRLELNELEAQGLIKAFDTPMNWLGICCGTICFFRATQDYMDHEIRYVWLSSEG